MSQPIPHIRWMIRRDMPEVLAIDAAGFAAPWPEEEFLRHLRDRKTIGMVAEIGERVVGWFIYEMRPRRLIVHRLAVHPDFRGVGTGRRMIDKLIGKLSPHRRTRIAIDVADDLLGAHLFLRACGFLATVAADRDGYECRYRFHYEFRDEFAPAREYPDADPF